MKTELNLLVIKIDMAPRTNRRWLVAILYGTLAALMTLAWMRNRTGTAAAFIAINFGLAANLFIGGQYHGKYFLFGSRGLVDPFDGNEILERNTRKKRSFFSRLFYPEIGDPRDLSNDERAIRRRDYSHFIAFRHLGSLVCLGLIIDFYNLNRDLMPASLSSLSHLGMSVDQVIFCILQVGWVFSCTLPQAILLWTEPDMEASQ
ncbi:MAG TPA: hypothetical protein VE291_09505 [Terracidiphilus sp.]|jgi:hypothetical protein|nr:hypothetical protein [Terracidiphilus sp.]